MVELPDHASQPVPLGALSASRSVPVASLKHLLSDLRRHDLVVNVRGPKGGYRLARPPAEIAVSDVVLAVDGPPTVADRRPAQLTYAGPASSLATVWVAALGCVAAILDGVTVEQLRSGRLPTSVQRLAAHGVAERP